jgi:hypothetical protein
MARNNSSPESRYTYQVFLSFRGPDTRCSFTDHLYKALSHLQIFRDHEEIERGNNIMLELEFAVKNSEMSVIVFSENYVASNACLQEVSAILEHSKNYGHKILPIFYRIEPADMKKKARELAANSTDGRKITWSNAVVEVSRLAGMHLKENDRLETEFIEEVVEMVEHMLTPSAQFNDPLPHLQNLVGIQSRVENIEGWLRSYNQTENDVILVMRGMAGIGKTTTAKFVFEENRSRFDASVFYENIKQEASKKSNYVYKMQIKLYSELIRKKVKAPWDPNMVLSRIKYELRDKKILVVLDDVDEVEQLDAILIIRNWLTLGSKIIITTTRDDLSFDQLRKYKEHRIENLSYEESVELFSLHAFGEKSPSKEFKEMSESFAKSCQGHPLALRVLGASVSGQSEKVWSSVLKSLEDRLDEQVIGKLKLSYESLSASDKNLFLDIACFFVGKKQNKTISILDGCGYHTGLGIQKLCHKNLLTIERGKLDNDKSRNGTLGMHQLLQYMAKQFVCNESIYPEDRSRIWRHKESLGILTSKNGGEKIEGLALDMNILKRNTTTTRPSRTRRSYIPRNDEEEVVETDSFQNMSKLRLLKLINLQPFGKYNVFPTNIRWLSWRWVNLSSLPSCFPPKNVVSFELRNNSLEDIWTEPKALGSLKNLNLSHSSKLRETPDVSKIPNLEQLILKGCKSLVEIHESTTFLERLMVLNLEDCTSLRNLPEEIGCVESLEELTLSGCSNLEGVADKLENMELKELYIDRTVLHKLLNPNTSSPITSPDTSPSPSPSLSPSPSPSPSTSPSPILSPSPSPSPSTSPSPSPSPSPSTSPCTSPCTSTVTTYGTDMSNYFLPRRNPEISWASLPTKQLVTLSMKGCNLRDDDFSSNFPTCPMLRNLYLGENLITKLPEFIRDLQGLHTLDLSWSPRLKHIEWPSVKVDLLDLTECRQLEEILHESMFSDGPKRISHGACMSLNHVQYSFVIHPVQRIDSEILDYLGFSHLKPIANVEVTIVNHIVWSRHKLPIQVLFELHYMYMSYYPGKEVPMWFDNKTAGSNISTIVPSTSSPLSGMNMCVVYTHAPGLLDMTVPLHVILENKTKCKEEKFTPRCYGVPEDNEDMVWLLHWPEHMCSFFFDREDEIEISFGLDISGEIKECGIQFLHHQDEDQESDNNTSGNE